MKSAEDRLAFLGLDLPPAVRPFGAYAPAVRTGNLLFLTGMLPTVGQKPKFVGRIGVDLDGEQAREAARVAALNALAVAREHLGSLDKISRVVRLGVYLASVGDSINMPKIADGASDLLRDLFGEEMMSARMVFGVASLPLGVPVELEVIFEVNT